MNLKHFHLRKPDGPKTAATSATFTASNYNITCATGTLTVNAASLTITAVSAL